MRASESSEEARSVQALQPAIRYRFRDASLLIRALTHPSFVHEGERSGSRGHYEAMEFLGDAVLGFLVAEMIYRSFPDRTEGEMSRLRAALVNERNLGEKADALGLGEHLRLGRGERASGGSRKRSILADTFESLLGAIYLDGGVTAARAFIRRQFGKEVRQAVPALPQPGDFKTRLQEIVQSRGGPPPVYRLAHEEGPPHRRSFEVEVELPAGERFRGAGWSKKQAEQSAAESALLSLGLPVDRPPRGR